MVCLLAGIVVAAWKTIDSVTPKDDSVGATDYGAIKASEPDVDPDQTGFETAPDNTGSADQPTLASRSPSNATTSPIFEEYPNSFTLKGDKHICVGPHAQCSPDLYACQVNFITSDPFYFYLSVNC